MIYHVLKDGSRVESIRDIVIKSNQFPQIYKVIEQIEKRGESDETVRTSETGA